MPQTDDKLKHLLRLLFLLSYAIIIFRQASFEDHVPALCHYVMSWTDDGLGYQLRFLFWLRLVSQIDGEFKVLLRFLFLLPCYVPDRLLAAASLRVPVLAVLHHLMSQTDNELQNLLRFHVPTLFGRIMSETDNSLRYQSRLLCVVSDR